jgi:excinuclease ABC subunit A
MAADAVILQNARQHNLKGLTIRIPRRALTVVTGPSGSGKSSLAFDTLYAEGQRRYIESLSTYAKQFLERMPKPLLDRLDGVSPAVAIEQKNPTTSSRSTVGTATEIYDYLRLLWARVGRPYCHKCGDAIVVDSPSTAAARVLEKFAGRHVLFAFPLPKSADSTHELILENLTAMGFNRVILGAAPGRSPRSDRQPLTANRLDDLPARTRLDHHDLLVVVDRISVTETNRGRLADAVALCFGEGEGIARAVAGDDEITFSQHPRCLRCGTSAPRLTPALFSFNNPAGACPGCNGFGAVLEYDEGLIVPDPARSLADGALDPWTKPRYDGRRRILRDTAKKRGVPVDKPWSTLPAAERRFFLHGKSGRFVGVFPFLRALEVKRYKQYIRVFLRQYQMARTCPACGGGRLRPEALAVKVDNRSIGDLARLTADQLCAWVAGLELSPFDREVAATVLHEVEARVNYLRDVGLGYLTLDRLTRTLSGGEAQRIALSNALGSTLVETLYVLDEPTIGLHPRDVGRLLDLLLKLRTAGNTVVVVEHDLAAIRMADYMVELGPGAGEHGGRLVYSGPVDGAAAAGTLTGDYLAGRRSIPLPGARRTIKRWLTVEGATLHNLHDLDVRFPLDALTVVTGVSGSGKSTLVHDVLYRQLAERLKGRHGAKEHLGEAVGEVRRLTGWDSLVDVVLVDQSPIGRTPRSNPVTYIRAFDDIRSLFAEQPLARARGYDAGTFSFNAPNGGRCEACEGAGHVQVEMVFLADVFVPCEACGGTRFQRDVLDVKIKGLSIADVLQLTVEDAIARFRHQERLGRALWHLQQVGLGYLRLGQPATTLSGGEAQRLKIARQLAAGGPRSERKLYLLDEPTTGLHLEDVRVLLKVLDRLVDHGHTVIVIEHHLDVIKRADWVIELGPEAGDAGGRVVAAGRPEEVAASQTHTGRFLRDILAAPALAVAAL